MSNVLYLNTWVSQKYLAEKLGVTTSAVGNWIARGQIEHIYVEELKMTLVCNINTISELRKPEKNLKKS